MENLNAEKVKKALKIHTGILDMPCEECPYNCDAHDEICLDVLTKDALALINSQEQRIGELEAECEQWRSDWEENQKQWEIAYDKLEAENLKLTEENERLKDDNVIRLPIKVGQTVYVPWRYDGDQAVATVEVEEIKFYDSAMHYMFLIDMESDDECFNQSFGGWKIAQSIGKTVFLTKEEAEKSLKGE